MKPDDHTRPGEWLAALSVLAHVAKEVFGGDYEAALKDINRVLANGRPRARVQSLIDGTRRELPAEFWQTHKFSSVGPTHIVVPSKEYLPKDHRYFLRQSDVEKLWPVSGGSAKSLGKAEVKRRKTSRRKWQQDTVAPVVHELWPNGPPKEVPTAVLLQQLGAELERRKIRASPDTQRRALGRR